MPPLATSLRGPTAQKTTADSSQPNKDDFQGAHTPSTHLIRRQKAAPPSALKRKTNVEDDTHTMTTSVLTFISALLVWSGRKVVFKNGVQGSHSQIPPRN